jgi:hypothetical protein
MLLYDAEKLVDVTGIEPVTQTGKNTKGFVWCRLYGKLRNFRSLKCPEVVPNFSAPLNFRMQFHVRSAIGNLRDCTVGALKPLSFTLLT